jgi:hypothetical protein
MHGWVQHAYRVLLSPTPGDALDPTALIHLTMHSVTHAMLPAITDTPGDERDTNATRMLRGGCCGERRANIPPSIDQQFNQRAVNMIDGRERRAVS